MFFIYKMPACRKIIAGKVAEVLRVDVDLVFGGIDHEIHRHGADRVIEEGLVHVDAVIADTDAFAVGKGGSAERENKGADKQRGNDSSHHPRTSSISSIIFSYSALKAVLRPPEMALANSGVS